MTVISTDGNDIEPIIVDTIFITSGERFDFVVNTNGSGSDYFIRVRALAPCNDTVEGFAVLRYSNGEESGSKVDFIDRKVPKADEVYKSHGNFNFPGRDEAVGELVSGRSKIVDQKVVSDPVDEVFHLFLATPKLDNEFLFRKGNRMKFMGKFKRHRSTAVVKL